MVMLTTMMSMIRDLTGMHPINETPNNNESVDFTKVTCP